MKKLNKLITKYIFLILSAVLLVTTFFNYLDYLKVLEQIEQDNLLIDVMFGGWAVVISFIIIGLYELIVKNKYLKFLIRIFLVLLFLGIILKNAIPIDDFDAGVENTSVFSGFITLILFLVNGLKKLFNKKHKLPAANNIGFKAQLSQKKEAVSYDNLLPLFISAIFENPSSIVF